MADAKPLILLAALVLDWFAGEPKILWARLPHPVVMFGKVIELLDRHLNKQTDSDPLRYKKGAIATMTVVLLAIVAGLVLDRLFSSLGIAGFVMETFVVFTLLAQRSLIDHVVAVSTALKESGVCGVREAVSQIVGRDTNQLDTAGVSRAAIESLAENFSDGVVAPVFWYVIFGLPGIMSYKMINTGDSMIGHKTDAYMWFGRTIARLDDLANWLPARISAGMIALGAVFHSGLQAGKFAITSAVRDAGLHRSPNAGWPEAAMAGACGIALGGPRKYEEEAVSQAWINAAGDYDAGPPAILQSIAVVRYACLSVWGIAGLLILLD